jgi:hypothetical protein
MHHHQVHTPAKPIVAYGLTGPSHIVRPNADLNQEDRIGQPCAKYFAGVHSDICS